MPGKTTRIGDRVIYKALKVPIPDDHVRFYPSGLGKWTISMARSFTDLLAEVGLQIHSRTEGNKYVHDDLPVGIMLVDNILTIIIYRADFEEAPSKLHNFWILRLPKHIEKQLSERFKVCSEVKFIKTALVPPRQTHAVHIEFDLNTASIVGDAQDSLEDFFGSGEK